MAEQKSFSLDREINRQCCSRRDKASVTGDVAVRSDIYAEKNKRQRMNNQRLREP